MNMAEQASSAKVDVCYDVFCTAHEDSVVGDAPEQQHHILTAAIERYFTDTEDERGLEAAGDAQVKAEQGLPVDEALFGDAVVTPHMAQVSMRAVSAWRPTEVQLSAVRRDVRMLVSGQTNGTAMGPRAVARILHGLGSPAYPPQQWARNNPFWERHASVDFKAVLRIAAEELARLSVAAGGQRTGEGAAAPSAERA